MTKQYTALELIRKIWPFFRGFAARYSIAMLLLVAAGLLSLLPPYLVKVLIDNGVRPGRSSIINLAAILLLLAAAVSGLTGRVMDYIHEWVSARFIMALRAELLARVLRQSVGFFTAVKTGDILSRLRSDTTAVYSVLVNTFIGVVGDLVQITGIAVFLFYMNWHLALVALAFVPLLHLVLLRFGKPLRRMALVVRDKDVGVLEFLQERVANVPLIKLYHREAAEERTHAGLSVDLIDSMLASVRYRFVSIFLVGFLTAAAGIVVLWYGGYLTLAGRLSVGSLFAFYLYTTRLYGPIQSLTNRAVDIYASLASAQRIAEFLDLTPSIVEAPHPEPLARPVAGRIAFRNVTFRYSPGADPVFRNFNLTIDPGQIVALVGASGAGKTTLANLLCRLYDVEAGSIQIDGVDIRNVRFQDLYDAMGVVPQETFLFNATIEENIRYGRENATREEIVAAARAAYLHEFVAGLPRQYQTVVGPRGASLSGGQRQRLALARVIVKNPRVWILDEFTSALDSRSEAAVHESLFPLLRDRTAIIIAHRHSTIYAADVVVVIDEGEVKEVGTHSELYSRHGLYKRLFDTQLTADVSA